MKNQALFSSKDKNKNLKCRLLQFLFGALRVNAPLFHFSIMVFFSEAGCSDFFFSLSCSNMLLKLKWS